MHVIVSGCTFVTSLLACYLQKEEDGGFIAVYMYGVLTASMTVWFCGLRMHRQPPVQLFCHAHKGLLHVWLYISRLLRTATVHYRLTVADQVPLLRGPSASSTAIRWCLVSCPVGLGMLGARYSLRYLLCQYVNH